MKWVQFSDINNTQKQDMLKQALINSDNEH